MSEGRPLTTHDVTPEGAKREASAVDSRPSSPDPPLQAEALTKRFRQADGSELHVLEGVELRVEAGEAVAVIGASGAGKSTLLHLLGGLDRPTSGVIQVGGRALATMNDVELAALRGERVGFVFQFHHLLREFTALENVMMPCLIAGRDPGDARSRAHELLDAVGLSQRVDHRPQKLSGGEQQRVAVARALSNHPVVLLADEPSGNLDGQTSGKLHDLLFRLRKEQALSMVLVTHNQDLARRADRTLLLEDGRLFEQG